MTTFIKNNHLYILSGVSGSGKSTFIKKMIQQGLPKEAVISSDSIRENILGSFHYMDDNKDVKDYLYGWDLHNDKIFEIINTTLSVRLEQGLITFVDTTALTDKDRYKFISIAEKYHINSSIILFNNSKEELLNRLSKRKAKIAEEVLDKQLKSFEFKSKYNHIIFDEKETYELIPNLLPITTNKLDIIGDTHGLLKDVDELLLKLGYHIYDEFYSHPEDRKVLFLGDAIDRSPNSIDLLKKIKNTCDTNNGYFILGNHENKLISNYEHYLAHNEIINLSLSSSETFLKFLKLSNEEQQTIYSFLKKSNFSFSLFIDKLSLQPTHEKQNILKIGFCHANNTYYQPYSFPRSFSLYGKRNAPKDTDLIYDNNYNANLHDYILFRGHIPQTSAQKSIYSLDRNQAFDGQLLCLQLDKYIELLKNNNWTPSYKFFTSSTIEHQVNFNYDEISKDKISFLKNISTLFDSGILNNNPLNKNKNGLKFLSLSKYNLYDSSKYTVLNKFNGLVIDIVGNIIVSPLKHLLQISNKDISNDNLIYSENPDGDLIFFSLNPLNKNLIISTPNYIDYPNKHLFQENILESIQNHLKINNNTLFFKFNHLENELFLIGGKKINNNSYLSTLDISDIASQLNCSTPFTHTGHLSTFLNNYSKQPNFYISNLQNEPIFQYNNSDYYISLLPNIISSNISLLFSDIKKYKEIFSKSMDHNFLIDLIYNNLNNKTFLSETKENKTLIIQKLINNNINLFNSSIDKNLNKF